MAAKPPLYDLTLLLSTTGEDEERAKILADTEAAITSAGGAIEHNQEWGTRPMTFKINHEREAEYHLMQFTGPTTLLEALSHTLAITDGVLRFRIIKVRPGTPPPPSSPPPVLVASAPAGYGAD
jgi:small subunit ribosomal protein S6